MSLKNHQSHDQRLCGYERQAARSTLPNYARDDELLRALSLFSVRQT